MRAWVWVSMGCTAFWAVLIVAAILLLAGCDSGDIAGPTDDGIARKRVRVEVGNRQIEMPGVIEVVAPDDPRLQEDTGPILLYKGVIYPDGRFERTR